MRKYARKNTAISEKNTLEEASDKDDGIIIILERAMRKREDIYIGSSDKRNCDDETIC